MPRGTIDATTMTTNPTIAPYGTWSSPVSASLLAEAGVGLGGLQAVGGSLFWLELRPLEGGRYALVQRRPDGSVADVTPEASNARTLVHEYGGGSYALHRGRGTTAVCFSEFGDQCVYRLDVADDGAAGLPQPLTRAPATARGLRYSDGCVTPDGRFLICVREEHTADGVANTLVVVATRPRGSDQLVLTGGRDFYAAPRLSPNGRALAWLCWDHPQMPWDGTELWVAELSATGLGAARRVAGGPGESVLQPSWDADGRLHYISDRSGWWNLYRAGNLEELLTADNVAEPACGTALAPLAAEFAKPPWVFGLQNYAFLADGRIVCFFSKDGVDHLALVEPAGRGTGDPGASVLNRLPCQFTTLSHIAVTGETVAVIGGNATHGSTLALINVADGTLTPVRQSRTLDFSRAYLAQPEAISFPTTYESGSIGGPLLRELASASGCLEAHALFYPPTNPAFSGPEAQRPPLVVLSHGGPTSSRESILSLDIQFWTSRGVAVVDVNYGGSTGYGRAYRERLRANWGIVDTVDCINAARHLVARGDVDPARIAVQGGSAGGYTTLNALTRHRFFAAGASYFGLADLELFAAGGTHKFESRYLDGLVGPYPEAAAVYRDRSPINHVLEIACPVILLQGLEDAIVPPAQAEVIVAALKANRLPYVYLEFAEEQHGFRKAESIVRAAEAVLNFYGRVFGFTPADDLDPLLVENLPTG